MPPVNPAAAAVASASVLGRFQGLEQFDKRTITFGTPFQTQYQPFNLTRPLESISIVWKGRVAVSVGAYADLGAEAPQNLLQNIRLEGQHGTMGNLVPISISGATCFAAAFLTQNISGNQVYISKAGGAFTLQARPTVPAVGTFDHGGESRHDHHLERAAYPAIRDRRGSQAMVQFVSLHARRLGRPAPVVADVGRQVGAR